MSLTGAADALMALFGAQGERAHRGALLLGAVLLANRPDLPNVVLDLDDE